MNHSDITAGYCLQLAELTRDNYMDMLLGDIRNAAQNGMFWLRHEVASSAPTGFTGHIIKELESRGFIVGVGTDNVIHIGWDI